MSCSNRSAGGMRSTRASQPGTYRRASSSACRSSSSSDASAGVLRVRFGERQRQIRGASARQRRVRQAHESRPEESRGAQIRRGICQKPDERGEILDLVGVEEAEPLVDVGRDAVRLERRSRTRDGWRASGRGCRCRRAVAGGATPVCLSRTVSSRRMRAISAATAAAQASASAPVMHAEHGRAACAPTASTGKRSRSSYLKSSARRACWPISANNSLTNASSSGTARKLRAIERRAVEPGRSASMKPARFLQHRDVGVAKAVDRLLAVADDEDRRLGGEPHPFAPGLDQQRDELPLLAAGVLELVDEHVVVAPFEAVAALRELVHPPEQLDGALEDVREIEQRSLVERLLVLRQRDREHRADAAARARR